MQHEAARGRLAKLRRINWKLHHHTQENSLEENGTAQQNVGTSNTHVLVKDARKQLGPIVYVVLDNGFALIVFQIMS